LSADQVQKVITPNYVAIARPVADKGRFFDFQNGGRPALWIIKYSNF